MGKAAGAGGGAGSTGKSTWVKIGDGVYWAVDTYTMGALSDYIDVVINKPYSVETFARAGILVISVVPIGKAEAAAVQLEKQGMTLMQKAGKWFGIKTEIKATDTLTRNVTKASELNKNMLDNLTNAGTIKSGGRSGGGRPLNGIPSSYVKTDAGHTLVYDGNGRLIYDISSERVKMTVWDKAPNGNYYPRDVKLEGSVPSELLK